MLYANDTHYMTLCILFVFSILIHYGSNGDSDDCLVTQNYAQFKRDIDDDDGNNEDKHNNNNTKHGLQLSMSMIHNRIIDGMDANDAVPFLVAILRNGRLIGSGTVIEQYWILTVAHLFKPSIDSPIGNVGNDDDRYKTGGGKIEIATGNSIYLSRLKVIPIQQVYLHRNYSSVLMQNDVALIRTVEPLFWKLKLIKNIPNNRIYLPYPSKREPLSNILTIIGWGDVAYGVANTRGVLQYGLVKVFDHSKCQQKYRHHRITAEQLCVYGGFNEQDGDGDGTRRTRACLGDSGGPVYEYLHDKPILVGMSSWTAKKCQWKFPNVYVKISYYLEWICATVKRYN